MAKRINISISDEISEQIKLSRKKFKDLNVSDICAKALCEKIAELEAYTIYRKAGFDDGHKQFKNIEKEIIWIIAKGMMVNNKSLYEKIALLEPRINSKADTAEWWLPRFWALMEDKLVLHDWVHHDNWIMAEDRRAEASYQYKEGWFEGVYAAYKTQEEICK